MVAGFFLPFFTGGSVRGCCPVVLCKNGHMIVQPGAEEVDGLHRDVSVYRFNLNLDEFVTELLMVLQVLLQIRRFLCAEQGLFARKVIRDVMFESGERIDRKQCPVFKHRPLQVAQAIQ